MRLHRIVAVVLVAAALVLALTAGSSPVLADEANHLQKATHGPAGLTPRMAERTAPLEAAIHLLLCAEARVALERPETRREILHWIVSNAQACPDTRLLVDTFGM
jgi:hypothetical protein